MKRYMQLANTLMNDYKGNFQTLKDENIFSVTEWLDMLLLSYNSKIELKDRMAICVFAYMFGLCKGIYDKAIDNRTKEFIITYFGQNVFTRVLELKRLRNLQARKEYAQNSNNPENPNKNGCCLAVCDYLGVSEKVKFLHTEKDVLKAVKIEYNVKKRKDLAGMTLNELHKAANKTEYFCMGFLVVMQNHVCFLDVNGKKAIDTAYRKMNKVVAVYEIY